MHGGPGASHATSSLPSSMRTNRLVFIDEREAPASHPNSTIPVSTRSATRWRTSQRVRQALGLGKISLLGHSFGGVLVQAYAFKYRRILSHLILGSTFASTTELNQALAKIEAGMTPRKVQ